MLDPGNLAAPFSYSYGYQDLPTVPAPSTTGAGPVAEAVPELAARPRVTARSLQASAAAGPGGSVELGAGPVSASVPLSGGTQDAVARLAGRPAGTEAPRVILRLEGITADGPPVITRST